MESERFQTVDPNHSSEVQLQLPLMSSKKSTKTKTLLLFFVTAACKQKAIKKQSKIKVTNMKRNHWDQLHKGPRPYMTSVELIRRHQKRKREIQKLVRKQFIRMMQKTFQI